MSRFLSRWLSPFLLPLVLAASTAHAAYPFGPGTPMPGIQPQAYERVCTRADKLTELITKGTPEASEQAKQCLNVRVKFELIRLAEVLEGLGTGGITVARWLGAGEGGYHETGGSVAQVAPSGAPRWYSLDEPEGAAKAEGGTAKLVKYLNEHCRGGSGGGPGGPGVLVERFNNFKARNPSWDSDAQFGPPLLPDAEPADKATEKKAQGGTGPRLLEQFMAALRDAKATRNYPGGALDETIEHALQGRLMAQDVERLHLLAGFIGYQLTPSAGFIRLPPNSTMLPTWATPVDNQPAPKR